MFEQYDDSINKKTRKKLRMKQFQALEKTLLNIARKSCPKDTHNMAENAIYSIKIKNGFSIVWDEKFAYYLPYVNEGRNARNPNSEKVRRNRGFVDRSIAFIMAYLFWDTGVERHKKIFNEKFKEVRKNPENEITRLGPLFIQQAHEIQKGDTPIIMDTAGEKMMTNLQKSIKKYLGKVNPAYSDKINSDLEYDIVNNEVYEIDDEGYYLRDKN